MARPDLVGATQTTFTSPERKACPECRGVAKGGDFEGHGDGGYHGGYHTMEGTDFLQIGPL